MRIVLALVCLCACEAPFTTGTELAAPPVPYEPANSPVIQSDAGDDAPTVSDTIVDAGVDSVPVQAAPLTVDTGVRIESDTGIDAMTAAIDAATVYDVHCVLNAPDPYWHRTSWMCSDAAALGATITYDGSNQCGADGPTSSCVVGDLCHVSIPSAQLGYGTCQI